MAAHRSEYMQWKQNSEVSRYRRMPSRTKYRCLRSPAISTSTWITSHSVAQRVLKNDDTVCGRKNPQAFEKLRHHLMALFPLEKAAIERLSAESVRETLNEVRASIEALRDAGRAL